MGTSMWGIGFAIVQSRMRKLLKRLVASPMLKREYLLAQVGGRLVLLAPEAGVPLLFGVFVLGLPVRGSIATTSIVCLVGALAFGGIGLLLASRARTFDAISGLMNLTMVPIWVLRGVLFSSSTERGSEPSRASLRSSPDGVSPGSPSPCVSSDGRKRNRICSSIGRDPV